MPRQNGPVRDCYKALKGSAVTPRAGELRNRPLGVCGYAKYGESTQECG